MSEKKPKAKALTAFMQSQSETVSPAPAAPKKASHGLQKATQSTRKTLSDGRVQALVYLQPAGVRELKRAVLDGQAESISAAVADAVNTWLLKHNRPPVA